MEKVLFALVKTPRSHYKYSRLSPYCYKKWLYRGFLSVCLFTLLLGVVTIRITQVEMFDSPWNWTIEWDIPVKEPLVKVNPDHSAHVWPVAYRMPDEKVYVLYLTPCVPGSTSPTTRKIKLGDQHQPIYYSACDDNNQCMLQSRVQHITQHIYAGTTNLKLETHWMPIANSSTSWHDSSELIAVTHLPAYYSDWLTVLRWCANLNAYSDVKHMHVYVDAVHHMVHKVLHMYDSLGFITLHRSLALQRSRVFDPNTHQAVDRDTMSLQLVWLQTAHSQLISLHPGELALKTKDNEYSIYGEMQFPSFGSKYHVDAKMVFKLRRILYRKRRTLPVPSNADYNSPPTDQRANAHVEHKKFMMEHDQTKIISTDFLQDLELFGLARSLPVQQFLNQIYDECMENNWRVILDAKYTNIPFRPQNVCFRSSVCSDLVRKSDPSQNWYSNNQDNSTMTDVFHLV